MSWTITPSQALPDDADAVAYIAAVEAADGEALEPAVRLAINSFVKGCKADGIWPSIKASCILAGARTLNGALVPLVGAAPTNYNFVTGDYNRKTGLAGDGSTKYLEANRTGNVDPQNSRHLAIWRSSDSSATNTGYLGNATAGGVSHLFRQGTSIVTRNNSNTTHSVAASSFVDPCFYGTSRSVSAEFNVRIGGSSYAQSAASQALSSTSFTIFRVSSTTTNDGVRLAFYSIGEALDLVLLDTRVTALVNALAAAIP